MPRRLGTGIAIAMCSLLAGCARDTMQPPRLPPAGADHDAPSQRLTIDVTDMPIDLYCESDVTKTAAVVLHVHWVYEHATGQQVAFVSRATNPLAPEYKLFQLYLWNAAMTWSNGGQLPDGMTVRAGGNARGECSNWFLAAAPMEGSLSPVAFRDSDGAVQFEDGDMKNSVWAPLDSSHWAEWWRQADAKLGLSAKFLPPKNSGDENREHRPPSGKQ